MSFSFNSATATHIGYVRELNEDSAGISNTGDLFVVADGMGGYEGGEIASSMTVETLITSRDNHTGPVSLEDLQSWLTEANRRVYGIADGRAGTTVTLLAAVDYRGPQLVVVNVGDSRTYRYRAASDQLTQLTEDHSAVQEMVRLGQLTAEEARHHPARNVITRAVGSHQRLLADVVLVDAEPGDRFLLTTDGMHQEIDDAELALILSSAETMESAAQQLVERALEEDGSDNITVLVVEVLHAATPGYSVATAANTSRAEVATGTHPSIPEPTPATEPETSVSNGAGETVDTDDAAGSEKTD